MGTVTVTRSTLAKSVPALEAWFHDTLEEMAREGGTDGYCGNWNSNQGLQIIASSFASIAAAEKYAEAKAYKRGPVLAMRIGDFKKMFPESKADQALAAKTEELRKAVDEFEWHILDRAQKGKSKIRKCLHCESGINVHKVHKPSIKDYMQAERGGYNFPSMFRQGASRIMTFFRELTDCPVCGKNLLKTATDLTVFASYSQRHDEAGKKLNDARTAHEAKHRGDTEKPRWFIYADCGD